MTYRIELRDFTRSRVLGELLTIADLDVAVEKLNDLRYELDGLRELRRGNDLFLVHVDTGEVMDV